MTASGVSRTASRLREVEPGASLGLARDDCIVCIPVFEAYKRFVECLHSVLRHTPPHVRILIADDASSDGAVVNLLRELDRGGELSLEVTYLRRSQNLGFVGNMNQVFEIAEPADVLVLNSDCMVADGWYQGMRDAARSDAIVATSSALTNNGTILSVPVRNRPQPHLPQDWTLDQAAAAVREASPRLRPRIPTALGHCMYIRRSALELVGNFDTAFAPGYGEEVDFSQRCIQRGLCHVAADDVLVWHYGSGSFGNASEVTDLRSGHDRMIAARYPYYERAVNAAATESLSPLSRSLSAARSALGGLSVTIDATCLRGELLQGTQVHVLELIHSLWKTGQVSLRVVLGRDCGSEARHYVDNLAGVHVLAWEKVAPTTPRSDIVHRPYQVNSAHELTTLAWLGNRLVITQQDLIAYRNPTYFEDFPSWETYIRAIRNSLGVAEAVIFFSQHAAGQAVSEGLVGADRAHVVRLGIDRQTTVPTEAPRPPRGLEAGAPGPLLVCLGADFHHKNRVFCLQVLEQLQRRHAWPGNLVLVGPKVGCGSSSAEETEFLLRHPELERATRRLAAVSEAERLWLMQHAAALLYPTVHEGFGFMPFEAAAAGVPCVFAHQTSLAELVPESAAAIVPWDPAATADRVLELINDVAARERVIAAIRAAGTSLSWEATAEGVLAAYRVAVTAPPRLVLGLDHLSPLGTPVARQLAGRDGLLPEPVQQALWAVARRRTLRGPLYAMLMAFHRLGLGLGRLRGRS